MGFRMKCCFGWLVLAFPFFILIVTVPAHAQSHEVQQLLLNVEKLSQLKNILRDMKRGYQVLSGGYNSVRNIAQGNFSLHEVFLDGLMLVSPEVRKYRRVGDIVSYQQKMVAEYKSAFRRFNTAGIFSGSELDYLQRVYGQLLSKSLNDLEELAMVITSSKLRMSDQERLQAIDRIFIGVEDKLLFLRDFNERTTSLGQLREKSRDGLRSVNGLYGREGWE